VWSPYLFCDENIDETRANRNPVISATPSEKVTDKKARHAKIKFKTETKENDETAVEREEQVNRFQTLLNHLATICKNKCRIANKKISPSIPPPQPLFRRCY
jgi:hypothetical protein